MSIGGEAHHGEEYISPRRLRQRQVGRLLGILRFFFSFLFKKGLFINSFLKVFYSPEVHITIVQKEKLRGRPMISNMPAMGASEWVVVFHSNGGDNLDGISLGTEGSLVVFSQFSTWLPSWQKSVNWLKKQSDCWSSSDSLRPCNSIGMNEE